MMFIKTILCPGLVVGGVVPDTIGTPVFAKSVKTCNVPKTTAFCDISFIYPKSAKNINLKFLKYGKLFYFSLKYFIFFIRFAYNKEALKVNSQCNFAQAYRKEFLYV